MPGFPRFGLFRFGQKKKHDEEAEEKVASGAAAGEEKNDVATTAAAADQPALVNAAGFFIDAPDHQQAQQQVSKEAADASAAAAAAEAEEEKKEDDQDSLLPPLGSLPDLHGRVSSGTEDESPGGVSPRPDAAGAVHHHGQHGSVLPPGVPGLLLGVLFSAIYGLCSVAPSALVASLTALFVAGYLAEARSFVSCVKKECLLSRDTSLVGTTTSFPDDADPNMPPSASWRVLAPPPARSPLNTERIRSAGRRAPHPHVRVLRTQGGGRPAPRGRAQAAWRPRRRARRRRRTTRRAAALAAPGEFDNT